MKIAAKYDYFVDKTVLKQDVLFAVLVSDHIYDKYFVVNID